MKLQNETIDILKNFSTINPSIVVKAGNKLVTKTGSNTILATATTKDEFPREFAIYELNKFLGVVSLMNEPELDFGDKQLTISAGHHSVKYTYCDPKMVKAPDRDSLQVPYALEFDMSADTLQRIIRGTSVLALDAVAIVGDGERITIESMHTKNPTSDAYAIEVGKTDKEFKYVIELDRINKLMARDYKVSISTKGAVKFEASDVTYWVAVQGKLSSAGTL